MIIIPTHFNHQQNLVYANLVFSGQVYRKEFFSLILLLEEFVSDSLISESKTIEPYADVTDNQHFTQDNFSWSRMVYN